MKTLLIPALCLLSFPALLAQQASKQAVTAQSAETFPSLTADYQAAVAAIDELRQKLPESEAYRTLMAAGDTKALAKLRADLPTVDIESFLARCQASATQQVGTEQAVPFLNWIALHATKRSTCKAAVNTLLENHLESKGLEELAQNLPMIAARLGRNRSRDALATLSAGNPHDMVQAHALYGLAMDTLRDVKADEDAKAEALELLDEAAFLAEGTELAILAGAHRFEVERLQIGMEAPDIVGEDLDQVPFKLSDYRGKVVVIDFWGDW